MMHFDIRRVFGAIALTLAMALVAPIEAQITRGSDRNADPAPDGSVMQIPAKSNFPITRKITLGVGRSMMMQFPMELRDVMIADPNKVDAIVQTSDRVFLVARNAGSTNAFFFDQNGNQVMTLEIAIGSDLSSLDQLLKRLLPSSNIRTDLAGTTVVLTGTVRTPADSTRAVEVAKQFAAANKNLTGSSAWTTTRTEVGGVTTYNTNFNGNRDAQSEKPVINLLTIEGEDQVNLRVQVAEVQRSVLKQFGVNYAANFSVGPFSVLPMQANSFPVTSTALGQLDKAGLLTSSALSDAIKAGNPVPPGCAAILPATNNSGYTATQGIAGGFNVGGACMAWILKSMERVGLVRTLAEPNLTAVSGESAKFLAGGEYPVPVSSSLGAVGISFKEYGVGVAFTPVVMSEGRISLKIDTSVSELSNEGALVISGTQVPSLKKRSALSTVELPSGGSIVMAGLLSDNVRQSVEGMPGLKDLPVLGALFRSRDFQQSETELVIIVTPILVRPTAVQNLAKPDDGLAPVSDLKGNFLGHLNRVYGRGRHVPDGGLKGNYGFIVE